MEIRKYYILKKTVSLVGSLGATMYTSYSKGYGNWTGDFNKARQYPKFDSIKRLIKKMATDEPNAKLEILYITMNVETIEDIVEKELLN